jgi:hypothetical protein
MTALMTTIDLYSFLILRLLRRVRYSSLVRLSAWSYSTFDGILGVRDGSRVSLVKSTSTSTTHR